jgi:hypothetical protein
MFLRMRKEKKPDYSDIGLGFIIMGVIETILWLFSLFVLIKLGIIS